MSKILHTKIDTDQAWIKVYSRLEQDGLIPEEKKRFSLFSSWYIRGAAAVLFIFITSTALFHFTKSGNHSVTEFITLSNETGTTTLVATLEDGSVVYLAENTYVSYPQQFEEHKREIVLQGNAMFDVEGDKQRPFLIDAKLVKIEVLGTSFNVKNPDNNQFELSVKNGEVKVTLKKNGESILVKAGETASLFSTSKFKVEQTKDWDQFSRYTGLMQFKDEKIVDIVRVLNKESQTLPLEISPSLNEKRLTVSFSGNSSEEIAELICIALNLSYQKETDKIVIFE